MSEKQNSDQAPKPPFDGQEETTRELKDKVLKDQKVKALQAVTRWAGYNCGGVVPTQLTIKTFFTGVGIIMIFLLPMMLGRFMAWDNGIDDGSHAVEEILARSFFLSPEQAKTSPKLSDEYWFLQAGNPNRKVRYCAEDDLTKKGEIVFGSCTLFVVTNRNAPCFLNWFFQHCLVATVPEYVAKQKHFNASLDSVFRNPHSYIPDKNITHFTGLNYFSFIRGRISRMIDDNTTVYIKIINEEKQHVKFIKKEF